MIDQNVKKALDFVENAYSSIMRMHLSEKHQSNVNSGFLHAVQSRGEKPSGKQSATFIFDEFPHPHDQTARPRANFAKTALTIPYIAVLTLLRAASPLIGIFPTVISLILSSLYEIYYFIVAIIFNVVNLVALILAGTLYFMVLLPVEFFARTAARLTIESFTRFAGLVLIAVAFVLSLAGP